MDFAYVLYLDKSEAGPGLELLRRVCDPRSRSLPHITVRYPVSANRDPGELRIYEEIEVQEIRIVGPDSFDRVIDGRRSPRVVYLRCASPLLEAVSYKPDYPDSVFHLTMYDGRSARWAKKVLTIMREFRWELDVELSSMPLARIPIGRNGTRPDPSTVTLSEEALALFHRLAGRDVAVETLLNMDNAARADFVRKVCAHVQTRGRQHRTRVIPHSVEKLTGSRSVGIQQALWRDPHDDDPGTPSWALRRREMRGTDQRVAMFLTPPELAQDLVRAAVREVPPTVPIDFGDPAVGSGIFFAATLREVGSARVRSAIGMEVDQFRAEQTSLRWRDSSLVVRVGDFFTAQLEPDRSLVIANPPYVRFQRLDARDTSEWRRDLKSRLGLDVDGRADLYVYFLLRCHAWLAPSAVSAWLLPSEFLQSNYGSAIREYLSTQVTLVRLHTYDSHVSKFENARVSSSVIIFRNVVPQGSHRIQISHGGTLDSPDEVWMKAPQDLRTHAKWTATALRDSGVAESEFRLDDFFSIRRGIATGANSAFVLSDEDVERVEALPEWLKPVIPRSRLLVANIIESDDDGTPLVGNRLWLIDTSADLAEIRARSPVFARYLESVQAEYGTRNLLRSRKPFYRQEQRPVPPFFVGYMSRASSLLRSRFFLNRSRAVVLNNYFGLYPLPHLARLLETGEVRDVEVLDMLASIDESRLAAAGRTYVSGLSKLEPREVGRVPVDSLPSALIEAARAAGMPRPGHR